MSAQRIRSPELNFCEPFTFSFFARSFADRFPDEKFVVAYSLTNATAASFIPLHCDTFTTTAAWTEYSFMVPAQAKYVAVHCVSHDQYVFCLDDLTIRGRQSIEQSGNAYRHESISEERELDRRQDRDVNIVPENLDGSRDLTTHHMATTLEEMLRWNKFPTYEVYTQLLQHFQDSFPNLCQIDTILDTTPHPDLHHSIFAIHISNTLGQTTTKPAFLYSSTMHGWE